MRGQRGIFLSILLIVNAVAITLASIVLLFDRDIQNELGVLPNWFGAYVIGLLLARLFALWGIWNLRRWAVFVYFLLEVVEVAVGLFVFTAFLTSLMRFVIGVPSFLALIAIYILALRPKWQWLR